MWADGRISNEKQAEGDQEADQKCERWRTARRDEHPARAKDKNERQPTQKEDGDERTYAGNRWNFGLIDARYDGVFHNELPFVVTCLLRIPFLQQRYRQENHCCAPVPICAISGINGPTG